MNMSKRFITWSYVALAACLVATICDLVSLAVFARLYPSYDPKLQPISALGATGSPLAQYVSGWWIFLGLVFLLFAFSYEKSNFLHNRAQLITAWLVGIYALCEETGSGLFPGNHLAGRLTTMGIVHNIFGAIGVIALMAIPFVLMQKYTNALHPAFYRFLWIISVAGLFFFMLFSISRFSLPRLYGLQTLHGFWQRLFVADYYCMLAVIAVKQVLETRAQLS
jgi:hypothetical protein